MYDLIETNRGTKIHFLPPKNKILTTVNTPLPFIDIRR